MKRGWGVRRGGEYLMRDAPGHPALAWRSWFLWLVVTTKVQTCWEGILEFLKIIKILEFIQPQPFILWSKETQGHERRETCSHRHLICAQTRARIQFSQHRAFCSFLCWLKSSSHLSWLLFLLFLPCRPQPCLSSIFISSGLLHILPLYTPV